MKSVKDACKPRGEVLKGDLEDAIFAADFGHVVEGIAPDVYKLPNEFFRNTYPTARLKKIVATIFERLANAKEAGAAVRLSTGFGGGKTHTLIALWHLANNISKTSLGTELLPAAGRPKKMVVAGIDASKGFETKSMWGELALKLGEKAAYAKIKSFDKPSTVPNAATVRAMLPDAPVLILLDELVIYMATLNEQERGSLLAFLSILIGEIGARTQAVLVITDPAGQAAYHKEAAAIADATAQLEAAKRLDGVLGRKMADFDPIGDEAAQVIIRRLFDKVDKNAAESASAEYFNGYKRVASEHPEALAPDALDYAKRIVDCYPFHPRLLETAQNRLGALQDFNKSRGTLRLFARILRDVMESKRKLSLITGGDINWESDSIQADLLQRLNKDNFKAAVDADVVRHAGQLDEDFSTDIHRRVASALLLESLPYPNPNAAMDKRELTLSTLRPTEVGNEASEAIDRLLSVCWHTYKDDSGKKYQFRFDPNVNKLIEERAESISSEDAKSNVQALAQKYFDGRTFALRPYPSSPRAVSDSAELKLILCENEKLAQAVCDYEDDSDPHAKRPRPFRNAIFAVAPTSNALTDAIDEMKRLNAAEEILSEHKKKTVLKEQVEELITILRKRVRIRTIRAFNRVLFQGKPSVTLSEKYLVSEESALETVHGQTKLKEFLDDNKLVYQPTDALDVDLLLDNVVKGATPSLDHKGAYPASAVFERALSHEKLRLMMNENPVRNAILRGVEIGKLAVRQPTGEAYDKAGCVFGLQGARARRATTLYTLRLDSDVLLAPISAPCVKDWFKLDEAKDGRKPKQGTIEYVPAEQQVAADWKQAAEFASKRPLLTLTLKTSTPDAAKTLVSLAQPFGARLLSLSVTVGGALKDGGRVNFSAEDLKHNHPLAPIDVAAKLFRAMADTASFEASLELEFGDEGVKDAVSNLKRASNDVADGVSVSAVFGKENE
jgi:hypothetical protein